MNFNTLSDRIEYLDSVLFSHFRHFEIVQELSDNLNIYSTKLFNYIRYDFISDGIAGTEISISCNGGGFIHNFYKDHYVLNNNTYNDIKIDDVPTSIDDIEVLHFETMLKYGGDSERLYNFIVLRYLWETKYSEFVNNSSFNIQTGYHFHLRLSNEMIEMKFFK